MKILCKENIHGLIQLEPKFQQIINQYGLPENWTRPQGFATLAKIILEQQVSLESAQSAWNKLVERLGVIKPKTILSLNQDEMKSCYVSRQKTKYLHELSKAVLSGDLRLEDLDKMPIIQVQQVLTHIKGIGPWTAQVYQIFALRSQDIYPRGDVALNNAVRSLWQVEKVDDIYELSINWSPYRTTASFLLWHQYLCIRGRIWKR